MITPDGCAVDFYARITARGEPEIVHDAVRPGASILELGCGTGRITHPLVALGHPVVAVDESPEMLAHVRDADTVCARIEELTLGRRFDAVLLASHLINTNDIATRTALLAACRRHVADDGAVIIQQHPPGWFAAAADAESVRDGIIFRMRDVSRPAPGLVSATVEYVDGDRVLDTDLHGQAPGRYRTCSRARRCGPAPGPLPHRRPRLAPHHPWAPSLRS